MQKDKPPTRCSLNGGMITWMRKRGMPFNETVHKVHIYKLAKLNKPRKKKFRIDTKLLAILNFDSHRTCVKIENELLGAKINHMVRESNVTGGLSV
jgi:hypothetical protein